MDSSTQRQHTVILKEWFPLQRGKMEQILQNIVFEEIEYKYSNPELKLGLLFRLKSGETIRSILEKLENLEKLVKPSMEKLEVNMLEDFDSRRRYKRNIKDDYFGVSGNPYYRPQQPTTILLELLQQPGSSSNSIALDDLKIQIPAKNVVERVSLSPVLGNEFLTQAQHVYKDYEGVFNVLPKKEDRVIILVKLIDGKVIPLRVGASETAFDVKVKIFVKKGNPTAFQRLFFAGKQLKNEPFIGIQMLLTLQLMLPLPGGQCCRLIEFFRFSVSVNRTEPNVSRFVGSVNRTEPR
uniref:Ubiquitin-like domain-containing protein n=1 Tax=Panagrolaimus superbus TaxID=310955 RepID=A0A914Z4P7_9BILA